MANERRLIDATEAEEWAREHILDAVERYTILDFLRECSTVDAVEVVRCGECRYSTAPLCHKEYCKEKGILKCDKPGGIAFNRRVYSTDFCSYGKKQEVE